ncbi:MAG: hypothetical protein H0T05_00830 [Acidobacteria bacterium]|nr:hypothetical protein [Acidobacteriota bacterium]MBA3886109.1 hypothetical protein [Acidobacteriota bacterium]
MEPALAKAAAAGVLRHEQADVLSGWIDALVAAGLVRVSADQYRTLGLTTAGREVMHGRAEPSQLAAPSRTPRASWRGPHGMARWRGSGGDW